MRPRAEQAGPGLEPYASRLAQDALEIFWIKSSQWGAATSLLIFRPRRG